MATKKTVETIEIKPVEIAVVDVRIVGDTPLIMHRWSEKAKRQMLEDMMNTGATPKRPREPKAPVDEFCRSMYWMEGCPAEGATDDEIMAAVPNGRFGFPVTAIKQAAISAAFRSGMSKDKVSLQAAFFIDGEGPEQLAEVKGDKPIMREDMVKVNMGKPDMRYRGEFHNWYMDLTIRYNKNGQYTLKQILNIINMGGFGCGIGEWRPEKSGQNGMYHLAVNKR